MQTREDIREYQRAWREANRERLKEYSRAYYIANEERILKTYKTYRDANKEKMKVYHQTNKAKLLKYQIKYHKIYREVNSERIRAYRKSEKGKINRHNANARRRSLEGGGRITLEEWNEIKANCKGYCFWCRKKFKDSDLTKDHVIPLSKGGEHAASNIVPACKSCNSSKRAKILTLV